MLFALLVLSGCAHSPLPVAPAAPSPARTVADPQRCDSRADCTTKISRTLLFVFDYAAAGAPLVQREGRLLFTPLDATLSDWPAIQIRLAEPANSRFDFNAACRAQHCRYDAAQLLRVYRSYLEGTSCSLLLADSIRRCGD
ncbi:MAG: hypothetical protein ACN6O6_07660 [Pseudomonas sp.]|uniref:hypothetical protein n=1 Tax=Pseudomonas sp. TaxID=306 RepID=UPI003D0C5804